MGLAIVVALLAVVISSSLLTLSVKNLEWDSVSIKSISESNVVSSPTILYYRILCALVVWTLNAYLFFDPKGLVISLMGRDGQMKTLKLVGIQRFTMFTVWCWTAQGYYFVMASICSILSIWNLSVRDVISIANYSPIVEDLLVKATWVLFEVSFAMAYLVTVVVTFVLIPAVKQRQQPSTTFFLIPALVMHNLNVITMTGELLLTDMSFALWHFPFVLLFGCSYIIFQWIYVHRSGVFYYFFLDYDKPGAIFWYIGLIVGVAIFFFFGLGAYYICGHHTFRGEIAILLLMLATLQIRDYEISIKKV